MKRHYTNEISRTSDASIHVPAEKTVHESKVCFLVEHRNFRAEEMLYKTTEENSESAERRRREKQEEEDRYKDARKLRNAIKQSKRQCWKVLCFDVDRDP